MSSSGRTITYAQKPFLNEVAASIQTMVLVDRKHKQFPISPDYVGLQLSTTLQDKITVLCEGDKAIAAYLD
ncbi:MAG: phosphoribosyltransferase [Bacteroidetes bacterium OLB11]|nr:MAG: phosphoribosyltransferase [Bacteroidetes bacterium OLB11]